MSILVIDNYDSFTYNLVHLVEGITDEQLDIYQNDAIDMDAIGSYDRIILSPGPGLPKDAGIMIQLIKNYGAVKKILGICLGHQAIAEAYGGRLYNLDKVFHGIATKLIVDIPCYILNGLSDNERIGRYHSWVVDEKSIEDQFNIIARDENGLLMGIEHKEHSVIGLQFHPESILSSCGRRILDNWLNEF